MTLHDLANALAEFLPLADLPPIHPADCPCITAGLPELITLAERAAFRIVYAPNCVKVLSDVESAANRESYEDARIEAGIAALRLMYEHRKAIGSPATREGFHVSDEGDRLVFIDDFSRIY